MKTARKTCPVFSAMYPMKNASDPATRVPNPLLSPLHKVAPIIKRKKERIMNQTNDFCYNHNRKHSQTVDIMHALLRNQIDKLTDLQ